jgi:hypothetical protein
MSDNRLVILAAAIALVGAILAGTALRDQQAASIGARNHTGVEPRDVFGFRDRQERPDGYARRECRGSIWGPCQLDPADWREGRR